MPKHRSTPMPGMPFRHPLCPLRRSSTSLVLPVHSRRVWGNAPPRRTYLQLPHARAARGMTPGRLFRSLSSMDQMPDGDGHTGATVQLGYACHPLPGCAARASSLRVVPCALRVVKGISRIGSSPQLGWTCSGRRDAARGGGR
jgi:hypothetical protein